MEAERWAAAGLGTLTLYLLVVQVLLPWMQRRNQRDDAQQDNLEGERHALEAERTRLEMERARNLEAERHQQVELAHLNPQDRIYQLQNGGPDTGLPELTTRLCNVEQRMGRQDERLDFLVVTVRAINDHLLRGPEKDPL